MENNSTKASKNYPKKVNKNPVFKNTQEVMSDKRNHVTIILKCFDSGSLDNAVKTLVNMAKSEKIVFKGPIPMPIKKTRWTVLSSPHVFKRARNQYEQFIYSRILIMKVTANSIDAISRANLPAGVDVKISLGRN